MKASRTTSGKYVVEAVLKALDVLEAFADSEGLALVDVSQRVRLNKSRTFRLLYTLAERGYVERSADGLRYKLGVKLLERAALVRRDIRDVARPFMLELQKRFNEMVNLGVLDNGHVLYVDIVESSRPFRMSATVGCRMTTHRTALGKAMLAHIMADEPGSLSHGLVGKLPKARLQVLRRELKLVRSRGYAVDNEDNEPGVACIGAAILDAAQRPVAAISVSGPVQRILSNEKKIAAALVAACKSVSRNLGVNVATGAGRAITTQFLPRTVAVGE